MRHARNIYRLFALAGVLGVVAWGCSTDSPTAPRQTPPPLEPPPGQAFNVSLSADPGGIAVPTSPLGTESTTVTVTVSPAPAAGTTILLTTNIGQFDPALPVRSGGVALVNGRGFVTLFAGAAPVQFGVATIQGTLSGGQGQVNVPITLLEADFAQSNPEVNFSVNFTDTSVGGPESFFWQFGDGGTSTQQNPVHVYPRAGVFQVKLTVTKVVDGVSVSDDVTMPVTIMLPEIE